VETFFNLAWIAISLALGIVWLTGYRRSGHKVSMSTLRVQCIALGVLILILLPVVSLSDDMQTMMATSEMEHVSRRIDVLPVQEQPAQLPLPLLGFLNIHVSFHLRTFAQLEPVYAGMRTLEGFLRQMANRPPPACA
jgi:hypothetical protein